MNISDDIFIAILVTFIRVAFEKVFVEPLAIVFGQRASVELLARGYETIDFFMGELTKTYEGDELREAIRTKLEEGTKTKWTRPMVKQLQDNYDEAKAQERIERTKQALIATGNLNGSV